MRHVCGYALARQFYIIDTIMRRICPFAAVLVLWLGLLQSTALFASPVLLTFDVEAPTDEDALKKLSPDVPATYFVTGEFAENHNYNITFFRLNTLSLSSYTT